MCLHKYNIISDVILSYQNRTITIYLINVIVTQIVKFVWVVCIYNILCCTIFFSTGAIAFLLENLRTL